MRGYVPASVADKLPPEHVPGKGQQSPDVTQQMLNEFHIPLEDESDWRVRWIGVFVHALPKLNNNITDEEFRENKHQQERKHSVPKKHWGRFHGSC